MSIILLHNYCKVSMKTVRCVPERYISTKYLERHELCTLRDRSALLIVYMSGDKR